MPALSAVRRVAVPRPAPNPDGRGSTVVPDRDEDHLDGIVLMTDRGLEHDRNEDAAAAGTVAGAAGQRPHAIVAAVCDGVSTSPDAYKASRAASTAGVEAMLNALAASRDMSSVVLAGLDDAAKAAAAAKTRGCRRPCAPACTYAAAAVVFTSAGEAQITVANVGDSRAYWLPEPPAPPLRLTVDDSLAQGLISAGVPPDAHVVQKGAHTLTRWLGGNAKSEPWDDVACEHDDHRRPRRAAAVLGRPAQLPVRGRRRRAVLQRNPSHRGGESTGRPRPAVRRSRQHHRRADPDRRLGR